MSFCRYLTGKIQDGEAHSITCPGFQCTKLVPVEVIETLVSRDIARRYLQFDIKVSILRSISVCVLSVNDWLVLANCRDKSSNVFFLSIYIEMLLANGYVKCQANKILLVEECELECLIMINYVY